MKPLMPSSKRSMPKVDIIVIALAAPIQVGVYRDGKLEKVFRNEKQASDYLPEVFDILLGAYSIASITYANGPGSFMAIKMSYLFLKTLEIVKGIELLAASAFEFNGFTPIKAMGKLYFHYNNGAIITQPLGDATLAPMELPNVYERQKYSKQTEPNYILPAVS